MIWLGLGLVLARVRRTGKGLPSEQTTARARSSESYALRGDVDLFQLAVRLGRLQPFLKTIVRTKNGGKKGK